MHREPSFFTGLTGQSEDTIKHTRGMPARMDASRDHDTASLRSPDGVELTSQSANDSLGGQDGSFVPLSRENPRDNQVGAVISRIEDIFETIVDALADGTWPRIPILSRRSGRRRGNGHIEGVAAPAVSFPGRRDTEALKFCMSRSH